MHAHIVRFGLLISVGLAAAVGGCAADRFADPTIALDNPIRPAPKPWSYDRQKQAVATTGAVPPVMPPEARFRGVEEVGSGSFVSTPQIEVRAEPTVRGNDGITLNLLNVPIAQAAKSVLGDVLKLNYTISDKVTGTVTIQTATPMSRDALVDVFESALKLSGAMLVRAATGLQVVPLQGAAQAGARLGTPRRGDAGLHVQPITLRYITPTEMKRVIEPIAPQGSILAVDDPRNLLLVAGTPRELQDIAQLVGLFDVDWMKGMSVGVYPVVSSDPEAITRDIEAAMGLDRDGPMRASVRIVPNRRLASIMVIASRPNLLDAARRWIHNFDKVAVQTEEQLFVYKVKNRTATELAAVLTRVLSGRDAAAAVAGGVAPRLEPVTQGSDTDVRPVATGSLPVGAATGPVANASGASATSITGTGVAGALLAQPPAPAPVPAAPVETERTQPAPATSTALGRPPRIVADDVNNSLLITATRREYDRAVQVLTRLDVLPTQVMLEAVIAEVTLTDELRFGVKWAIGKSANKRASFSDLDTGAIASQFPGFSYFFQTTSLATALDALQQITKVNVLSAPSLMVLDNRKATLQVGDQVPIATQTTSNPLVGNGTVINSIQQRDTGIILNVAPRVSDSGRVVLDIEQEVSNVARTNTSGIDSPTFQQRRLRTTVVVADGEVIALGGLIQERDTVGKGQVPILGEIPLLGTAFRQKSDEIQRTELMIFLRPTVVRDAGEARDVTEEFRQRLHQHIPTSQRGRDRIDRDANRILR